MPRPYNKKTVRDAIYLLDIYASNNVDLATAADAAEVRLSSTGYRVADHLVDKLADMFPEDRLAAVAGEAAGLLREGWRIGDAIPRHPNTQHPASLKSVDTILREQYPAHVVEHVAGAPSPAFDFASVERTIAVPTEHGAFGPLVWNSAAPTAAGTVAEPALADALDAVEEPSDEMIAGVETGTDIEIEDREVDTYARQYDLEPSE